MDEANINVETEVQAVSTDDDALMPEGWDGVGDFFDDASWTDDSTVTEEDPTTVEEEVTEEAEPVEEPPTTEEEPVGEAPHTLKFKAKVDHNDLDVELSEADLPDLYQKAQVVDRVQSQMGKMKTTNDRANKLAKGMGFGNADEMLLAAAKNHLQNEINRLVNDEEHPVHPDVARDIVERRLGWTLAELEAGIAPEPEAVPESVSTPAPAQSAAPTQGRDIESEVQELLNAHPELIGKELPDEVAKQAISSGERLLNVYQRYEQGSQAEKMKSLVKENQVLKQNAETANRAPVIGVTGQGMEGNEADDPFMKGFNEEVW